MIFLVVTTSTWKCDLESALAACRVRDSLDVWVMTILIYFCIEKRKRVSCVSPKQWHSLLLDRLPLDRGTCSNSKKRRRGDQTLHRQVQMYGWQSTCCCHQCELDQVCSILPRPEREHLLQVSHERRREIIIA
jgi:hypothetical protein